MRKSAIALAFFATFSTVSVARADDDFSALLADLDFGDAPSYAETLTPATEPAQLTMPEVSAQMTMPEVSAPQITLKQPIADPPAPEAETIDMSAAFALQESKSGVQAQTVGHPFSCGKDDGCDSDACEDAFVCTPHTAPVLPTSTFYQYFRSNKCNSHVWDGYRQPCGCANAHINGTCDCFKDKESVCEKLCNSGECGQIIAAPVPGCNDCHARPHRKLLPIKKSCDDCTSCDTGCDR